MKDNLESKYKFKTNDLYFYFLIFFITFVIFRMILPLGDEPDYAHRYENFIFNFEDFLYYSHDFNQATTCNKNFLEGELFDPFMKIAPFFCNNSMVDFFQRIFIGFCINFLYFFLIFILFKSEKVLKFLRLEKDFNNLNMHIFFCSLIYPTVIYYLSTRSNEFFLYYFSLLFFLCWRNYIISYSLALITLLIDVGNGAVFFIFINYLYLIRGLKLFISTKVIVLSLTVLFICLSLFHEYLRVFLAEIFRNSGVVILENMTTSVYDLDKNFTVPNYIKLIITYLSFVFLSPGFLKSTILTISMSLIFIYIFLIIVGYLKNQNFDNFSKKQNFFEDYFINVIACITFVILMVLIFPTHSFIRYYIFIFPFIFSLFFLIFNSKMTFLISIYAILFLSIETILFRIIYYL